jgi:hypothetical protein
MSELFAVKLTVQPDPLVQLKLEYRWAAGTWFNVTEQRHTGPDSVALCMRTPSTQVSFGDKLSLTSAQWRAVGSPLLLTLNEIQTIKQVFGIAHSLDRSLK